MKPEEFYFLVQNHCGIDSLKSKNRTSQYTFARYLFFALCKHFYPNMNLKEIGSIVKRDHSTVLHGLRKFEELYSQKTFRNYRLIYDQLVEKINNRVSRKKRKVNPFKSNEQEYRVRFIKLVEKENQYRKTLQKKLTRYQKSEVIDQLFALPEAEFKQFETIAKIYLKQVVI